ncbi:GNAT family N-acetyltransferase [Puia dinghuensis]|uniref:N-acetyltransferase n=1 Tax=Puia dinghuensis TaxID=1792502 RepID=A0A8J2XRD0_9BACT|nr:GNAT family N-acetyltransferase [Puia dinghuensis]GGB00369.1 N-acetyltransferase [Puia dinghuensis]
MPITSAGPADIPALVALVNSAYRSEGGQQGWTHESHLISGSRTDAAGIQELLQTPGAVILKYPDASGVILGCVYLQQEGDTLYLGLLSVQPAQQNAGIGRRLLAAADDYACRHHCKAINITVISVRHELLAWYQRHGYRRTGEIKPFHAGEKFGIQKQPLELVVLEKPIPA